MSATSEYSLQGSLAELLNRHSRENRSNTPDFILANYMMACLRAFEQASNEREEWYGTHLSPGEVNKS